MKRISRFQSPGERLRHYRRFDIPKKNGGVRTILAPVGSLKDIQRTIGQFLSGTWAPGSAVHGFANGRSVVSGAQKHLGARYLFQIDLKDFFPSITGTMVCNALVRVTGLDIRTARLVSDICSYPLPEGGSFLPQGSPASPVLSNIVCERMDRRIAALSECFGLTYTRYADDLSFSASYNAFREGDAFRNRLETIIADEGFVLNEGKTRLQKRGSRQEVTGVTVSEKRNVPRRWLKGLRARIHRMETQGCTPGELRRAKGMVAWVRQVRGDADPLSARLSARLQQLERNRSAMDDEYAVWLL